MAEISNAQVVNVCNENMRPVADALSQLVAASAVAVETYDARDAGTIIDSAGAGNFIADGSAVDGRTRVTGGDVYNLVTLLNDFATFMTVQRRDVMEKWRVNG